MPVVVEPVARERVERRRSRPEVVVNTGRDWLNRGAPNAVPRVEAEAAGEVDVADQAFPQFVDTLDDGVSRAGVGSMLYDSIVFLRGPRQLPALPPVMGAGLLNVNVLPGLASPDSHQGVPVVGSGDGNSVERRVFQHFPNVGVGLRRRQRHAIHIRQAPGQNILVHITDRGNFHVRQPRVFLHMREPLSPDSADADPDAVVRAENPSGLRDETNSRERRRT
jgi:hypothetical protein